MTSARSTCGPPATDKSQRLAGVSFQSFLFWQQFCQWRLQNLWFLAWKRDHKREYNKQAIHLACVRYKMIGKVCSLKKTYWLLRQMWISCFYTDCSQMWKASGWVNMGLASASLLAVTLWFCYWPDFEMKWWLRCLGSKHHGIIGCLDVSWAGAFHFINDSCTFLHDTRRKIRTSKTSFTNQSKRTQ